MKYCLAALFIVVSSTLYAQSFQYQSFTTKDGLSSDNVHAMTKDAEGFLWIATNNGLNRFDGNAFDVFYNNPNDSLCIASNEVQDIMLDSKKNIWVSTIAGISKFNKHNQQFENYAPDTLVMPKIGHSFFAIEEDAKGLIWVGGWYDLLIFNPQTKKFSSSGWAKFADKIRPANAYHSRVVVLSIVPKNAQEFWILTTYGLYSVNTQNLSFQFYPYLEIEDYYGCSISFVDDEKNIWINTYNNGILLFNTQTLSWKSFALPNDYQKKTAWNITNGITHYSGDTIILCANKALIYFDKKKQRFLECVTNDKENKRSLPDAYYNNILKVGNSLWLMTSGSGIIKMDKTKDFFHYHEIPAINSFYKIFSSNSTGKLIGGDYKDKTIVWDPITQKSTPLNIHTASQENGITGYAEIDENKAFIATENNFFQFVPKTLQLHEIKLPPKQIKENPYSVRTIVIDREKNIWIRCRSQGILQYHFATNSLQFAKFISPSLEKEYTALWYDSITNSLIVGVANDGIYIYGITTGVVQHILMNVPPSQRGANISSIIGLPNGNIYMADNFNGLYTYNTISKVMKRYTTYDGLASNNCTWLCLDANKILWIASFAGLSRLDPITNQFSNFYAAQSLTGYSDFLAADNKGNIYQIVQNQKGYHTWNTNDFVQSTLSGKIYLRNVKLNEKNISIDSVYNFTASENNISFQFGYLSIENTANVHLEYKLNNQEWISLDKENKISFSNLSPNRYTIIIRSKDHSATPITIKFYIAPPIYKTWWFILLVALVVGVLIYWLLKSRISSIKKQAGLKQKIAETEMMALKAQMNPHFIFNCISSIDNFILDNDAINASAYLNKFAKLIRNILDNSRNDLVPFWKDWETLTYYIDLEKLRCNDRFSYQITADPELLNGHYKIPPLIIQPYVENAIQHGIKPLQNKHGLLQINASLVNGLLVYTIKDNGVGRKATNVITSLQNTHRSYGMELTEQRIHLFNLPLKNAISITDLKDELGNNAGTLITITLSV